MSRITALIASLALVSSVSVAAAGGPLVAEESNQLVLSTQSAAVGSLGGLSAAAIAGIAFGTLLVVAVAVDDNTSGSH